MAGRAKRDRLRLPCDLRAVRLYRPLDAVQLEDRLLLQRQEVVHARERPAVDALLVERAVAVEIDEEAEQLVLPPPISKSKTSSLELL